MDDIRYDIVAEDGCVEQWLVDDSGQITELVAMESLTRFERFAASISRPYACVKCHEEFWTWEEVVRHFSDDDDGIGDEAPAWRPSWHWSY